MPSKWYINLRKAFKIHKTIDVVKLFSCLDFGGYHPEEWQKCSPTTAANLIIKYLCKDCTFPGSLWKNNSQITPFPQLSQDCLVPPTKAGSASKWAAPGSARRQAQETWGEGSGRWCSEAPRAPHITPLHPKVRFFPRVFSQSRHSPLPTLISGDTWAQRRSGLLLHSW